MRARCFWIATSCAAAISLLTLPTAAARTNNFKTLHQFEGGQDGAQPLAGLISDANGNLYGTTSQGGSGGYGTVFELTRNEHGKWSETVLYAFTGENGDGSLPQAGLMLDTAGNLFGTTTNGGAYGFGTVFMLTSNTEGSWLETVLYPFKGGQDGANPVAGLISDSNGNLFGTTRLGGGGPCNDNLGCGAVFELTPGVDGSWSEKVIYSFHGVDGLFPRGTLALDSKGSLYGTTEEGGKSGHGTAIQLVQNNNGTWTEHVLHSFGAGLDAALPYAGLTLDDQGNLYGTTVNGGGVYNSGVVFELTPNGKGKWKERILHSFEHNGRDGAFPLGSLVFDERRNLYGTTAYGGTLDCGTIFRLTPTAGGRWHQTALHVFKNGPGCNPDAGLLLNPHGIFFGTTGGSVNHGTLGSVFELTP
jgi:uncharacterized repeat protein (TIGR03803 family)